MKHGAQKRAFSTVFPSQGPDLWLLRSINPLGSVACTHQILEHDASSETRGPLARGVLAKGCRAAQVPHKLLEKRATLSGMHLTEV